MIHLFYICQHRRLYGTPQGLDDIHLFYYISVFGAYITIPLALLLEGPKIWRIFRHQIPAVMEELSTSSLSQSTPSPTLSPVVSTMISEGSAMIAQHLDSQYNASRSLMDQNGNKLLENHHSHSPFLTLNPGKPSMLGLDSSGGGGSSNAIGHPVLDMVESNPYHIHSVSNLLMLLLLNGFCYFLYNQSSFIVLSRVSFINHATLNVMRRIFIIIFTSWWFMISVSLLNMAGIVLAMSGFAFFLYLKVPGNASSLPL